MTDLGYSDKDFWLHTVQLARRGLFPVDRMKAQTQRQTLEIRRMLLP